MRPAATPAARVAGFIRHLRAEGFEVGVRETLDALRALEAGPGPDAEWSRIALRALSCRRQEEWRRFDRLFHDYWQPGPEEAVPPPQGEQPDPRRRQGHGQGGVTGLAHSVFRPEEPPGEDSLWGSGAGRQNTLARADFRFLRDPQGRREMERLAERLALRIRRRRGRRPVAQYRGRRLHFRRTLRDTLAPGGGPLRLRYLEPRRELPPLVLIQDVSHSMAGYTPLTTRFVRGLLRAFPRSEAFVFHIRLFRVTHLYREQDPGQLCRRLEGLQELWFGGTRIADSLACFNRGYGRLLRRRSRVLILSDGCDTDEPERLLAEIETLRRRCGGIYWLDPLLGRGSGDPTEDLPAAVVQRLDGVFPAHSLEGLEQAVEALSR